MAQTRNQFFATTAIFLLLISIGLAAVVVNSGVTSPTKNEPKPTTTPSPTPTATPAPTESPSTAETPAPTNNSLPVSSPTATTTDISGIGYGDAMEAQTHVGSEQSPTLQVGALILLAIPIVFFKIHRKGIS
ncbi:hypothetical protein GX563_09305 [Candidatus Bathyarchaeota archaeon]|nr:hypothetical protein [Candidatus Bathyarchaeota archaeon]